MTEMTNMTKKICPMMSFRVFTTNDDKYTVECYEEYCGGWVIDCNESEEGHCGLINQND